MNFTKTPVALAVAALLASPLVMASGEGDNDNRHHDPLHEHYSVSVENSGSVDISSSVESNTNSNTSVNAEINVLSKAEALVDDKQINTGNVVMNYAHDNNASVEDSAGSDATGNIGVNTSSGDNNMQDNATAIATADAYFVFGGAEARAMTTQLSTGNMAMSKGGVNNSAVGGSAFSGASGNLGINVASGNGNMQKNNLTLATAPSRASMASVQNVQRSDGNVSASSGTAEYVLRTAQINLTGGVSGEYSGQTGGTTHGTSDQIGDVYPDMWTGSSHPAGSQTGHFDLDTQTQGGSDLNDDGGALAFTNDGTYSGREAGTVALAGSFSGTAVMCDVILHKSENNAHLRGSALSGASGNIGVNIASGNGNLQNNSLSMAVVRAPVGMPNGGVPGPE